MHSELINYFDLETELEAFVAYPSSAKQPVVMLCHAWSGRDAYIEEKAQLIAQWGYVGFALDMYGKGIKGKSREENARLKAPFIQDRQLVQRRLLKAWEVANSLPRVDASRSAAVGFGFGGLCALDFARSGVSLQGVVSIYGHFDAPKNVSTYPIQAKVLIFHGYEDPVEPMDKLYAFEQEINQVGVDWQTHVFGKTMHAFTNPQANDAQAGILFNPLSSQRALNQIKQFLDEIFMA